VRPDKKCCAEGGQRPDQAVHQSLDHERHPNEPVRGPHEFHDRHFSSPSEDGELNGVDNQGNGPDHHRHGDGVGVEPKLMKVSLQAIDLLRRVLHGVHPRLAVELVAERLNVGCVGGDNAKRRRQVGR
jgi:hypothetical protein